MRELRHLIKSLVGMASRAKWKCASVKREYYTS